MRHYLICVLSVLLIFSVTTTTAQKQSNKLTKVFEIRAEKMAVELGLNDVEKVKVQALLEKQEKDYKQMKEKLSSKSADYTEKLKKLRQDQKKELEKVIGKEKFAKYEENRAQEKQKNKASKVQD